MSKLVKKRMAEELTAEIKAHGSTLFVADYIGLDSAQAWELRRGLRKEGARVRVVKNSLARMALKAAGGAACEDLLQGPTALVLCNGSDPARVARSVLDWSKKTPPFKVRGGVLQGKRLSPQEVRELASLPSKEALLARFMGVLASPISTFMALLQAPGQKFAGTLAALKERQEKAG